MTSENNHLFLRRSRTACAVTPYKDDLTLFRQIDSLINDGIQYFLFNADTYDGLRFAEQVLLRKKLQKGNHEDKIILIAVTENENAINTKDEEFRNIFFDIISRCDEFIDIRNSEPHACEKFMLGKSNTFI